MPATPFSGFPLELMRFLEELSANNNKNWFDKNKERYEQEVREPALAFITAMQAPLAKISLHFKAVPKKRGGSLMRVYRDVRFSKDKSPYKTNVGIQFRHEAGCDVHAPGLYFHIDPREIFLGAGLWRPESSALAAIRQAIDERSQNWKKAKGSKAFRDRFQLAGESLKRPPRGYGADHPLIDDLKRKDHIAICPLTHNQLFDSAIVRTTLDAYKVSKPYLRFLCESVGVDF